MTRRSHIDLIAPFGAAGSIQLPGSKSISNRALLLAALSTGETTLRNVLVSEDTDYMLDALSRLGIVVTPADVPTEYSVSGCAGRIPRSTADLFLGNAGTVVRPLTAVLALAGGSYRLSGLPRMHERPIGDLVEALLAIGARIRYESTDGFLPLEVLPGKIDVQNPVRIRGDISSQFLTSLLIALPLTGKRAVIEVDGELVSKPYVDVTLSLMRRFGVEVEREGWRRFLVPETDAYQSPGEFEVEGDASSASYFLAAGAIGGGPVRVDGVGAESIQGDVKFAEALASLGAQVEFGSNWIRAWSPASGRLQPFDLDLNHVPDAAMTLAAVALVCDGPSTLRNIGNWRVKETDRLAAMATELRKLGAIVEEGRDFLKISPPQLLTSGAAIDTYEDHRMAMSFALAALGPAKVRINDPDCVAKTYPEFFDDFMKVIRAPVIAIDGPSGSGKGTVARRVAQVLGYHYLDSGALYRLVALHLQRNGIDVDEQESIGSQIGGVEIEFRDGQAYLGGDNVTDEIRAESVSSLASKVAKIPAVRQSLMGLQRSFRRAPGLVADGRDMTTVVFNDAKLKVYLDASVRARAERRYKQLIDKGFDANLAVLLRDIELRDARDTNRTVAPLQKSVDAQVLDTTNLSIEEGVDTVVRWFREAVS